MVKERRIRNYWLNKEDLIHYISIKNKELKNEDRISENVAKRFRIAYNLSSIIFFGGLWSAFIVPIMISLFVGSELGGKIFVSWLGVVMLLISLILFYESYFGFKYKLVGTLKINSFDINKNKKGYIFAAVDEIRAPLWSIAMLILGIILIAIDVLIYFVFWA